MDLTKIKSAVLTQLNGVNSLNSLKIQNHIYGCFVIMEDITQHTVDVTGTILTNSTSSFDFDKQFGEIGLRYGFALDTQLVLDNYLPEYKETWLQYFKDIDLIRDINDVDNIEDCLIDAVIGAVKPEDAFFQNALESGTLSAQWIDKLMIILMPSAIPLVIPSAPPSSPNSSADNSDEDLKKTALSYAIIEKASKRKHATTRRQKDKHIIIVPCKKYLAKTRRHK